MGTLTSFRKYLFVFLLSTVTVMFFCFFDIAEASKKQVSYFDFLMMEEGSRLQWDEMSSKNTGLELENLFSMYRKADSPENSIPLAVKLVEEAFDSNRLSDIPGIPAELAALEGAFSSMETLSMSNEPEALWLARRFFILVRDNTRFFDLSPYHEKYRQVFELFSYASNMYDFYIKRLSSEDKGENFLPFPGTFTVTSASLPQNDLLKEKCLFFNEKGNLTTWERASYLFDMESGILSENIFYTSSSSGSSAEDSDKEDEGCGG